eukprot:3877116-Heterocapsa_arctica.AAC.1
MPLITDDEVRRVVNNLSDGKLKESMGVVQQNSQLVPGHTSRALHIFSTKSQNNEKWPKGLNPIIALIPKDGVEHGQLRPIAILPYIYRVWMAVRKSKVKQWAMKLNDGRLSSPETLVREIAARGDKCYETFDHKVAATAAVKTGCNSTIVALSFEIYRTPRVIQVHKSNTEPIEANRGILAGYGYAVHYLKAMIKEEVKCDDNKLRDFVDDMVLLYTKKKLKSKPL